MGCPFHSENGDTESEPRQRSVRSRTLDRRDFVRTALAIGGTGALAAVSGCTGIQSDSPGDLDVPQGPSDVSVFPERQHAWNSDLKKDPFGNGVLPNHQLLVFLNYNGTGRPTAPERETVETAFQTLERAFQRLTGGDTSTDNDGLVFMVGYSRRYFNRFETGLPSLYDFQPPEAVLRKTNDDVEKADSFDALLLLSSDTVPVLLAAEESLFGGIDEVNGVRVRATLENVFDKADRRTAFTGKGMPRDRLDNDNIPEDAPLSMGYKSGFADNLATEDRVTLTEGPFSQGTMMQVSKLRLDLDGWYDNDRETRDRLMFSHAHSPDEIGDVGDGLEDDSRITEDVVSELESQANEHGRVGHTAKTARARDEDFEPRILRRSEGVNNAFHDDGRVDFNFTAVMEGIEDFIETRQAMDSTDLDEHIKEGGHGIVSYTEVTNRATFLIPPRSLRALPMPDPAT